MDEDLEALLGALPDTPLNAPGLPEAPLCALCWREADDKDPVTSTCGHDPVKLAASGLGMYHCPECCAMVLAGLPHGPLCRLCAHGAPAGSP